MIPYKNCGPESKLRLRGVVRVKTVKEMDVLSCTGEEISARPKSVIFAIQVLLQQITISQVHFL